MPHWPEEDREVTGWSENNYAHSRIRQCVGNGVAGQPVVLFSPNLHSKLGCKQNG